MGAALVGNAVQLLGAVRLHRGVADLLQISEGGVDHAGAGRVEAAGTLFQRLDDLVAVAGFLRQQGQDQQLQLAGAELAPGAEALAAEAFAAHEAAAEAAVSAAEAAHE